MRLTKRAFSIATTVLVLVSPLVIWSQRQNIYDWSRLRNYHPSAEIESLVVSTTMNDYGKRLFYVNHPILESKEAFNAHCSDSEKTVVLGCYISHQGIYLYNVTDKRLDGVKEVTAAHEMLHAAYDRLPGDERQRLDNLLTDTFSKLDNARIKKTIESYRQKDPSVVPNELHSILGTEVRELPKELEDYYRQYFTSRVQVVTMSEGYEKAFTEQQDKIAAYDAQLAALKSQIDANQSQLNTIAAELKSDHAQLQALLNAKKYDEYNAAIPAYNTKVRSYNSLVRATQSLIDQYNNLVKVRNAAAMEENELIKAIDSRPSTINTQ
jgi:hypothetical protein